MKYLDKATIVLAGSLLYKNWQWPGAVNNATLREFQDCKAVNGGSLYIMAVENHKTAVEGVAKVVMDPVDHGRVIHYIETVRRVQVGESGSCKLFVLSGGRSVENLSSKLKTIGVRYGLCLPSATRVRKIGATAVALNLGQSPKANLVTRQMSHSLNTEAMYYQAIVGYRHAASAFSTMSELRKERQKTPVTDCEEPLQQSTLSHRGFTQLRRAFSKEETESLESYFSEEISTGMSVSLIPWIDLQRIFKTK
jgi:hypothetical protein